LYELKILLSGKILEIREFGLAGISQVEFLAVVDMHADSEFSEDSINNIGDVKGTGKKNIFAIEDESHSMKSQGHRKYKGLFTVPEDPNEAADRQSPLQGNS
jgi:hypothetical protein